MGKKVVFESSLYKAFLDGMEGEVLVMQFTGGGWPNTIPHGRYKMTLEQTPKNPDEETGKNQVVLACQRAGCKFYAGGGVCGHESPCITLYDNEVARCWSRMNKKPELKSCPHCSSEAEMFEHSSDYHTSWQACCETCGSSGPMEDTEDAAIAAWNRRE